MTEWRCGKFYIIMSVSLSVWNVGALLVATSLDRLAKILNSLKSLNSLVSEKVSFFKVAPNTNLWPKTQR